VLATICESAATAAGSLLTAQPKPGNTKNKKRVGIDFLQGIPFTSDEKRTKKCVGSNETEPDGLGKNPNERSLG
jgi:hypothetical protein